MYIDSVGHFHMTLTDHDGGNNKLVGLTIVQTGNQLSVQCVYTRWITP